MPLETLNLETRITALNTVLTEKHDRQAVDEALRAANGDMPGALVTLKSRLSDSAMKKVVLAHSLAVWSGDHASVVKAIAAQADITSLRDVALHFGVDKLANLVDSRKVPADTVGSTADEKKKNFAAILQNQLFTAEPTAVLQRMVLDAEVPIADANHRAGVASFLANQPDFNIRTTSIYTALKNADAFKGIASEHRAGVVEQLKTLQRVQAISPIPAAVPMLMKANLTSAFRVAEIPETTFLKAYGPGLGAAATQQLYTAAINSHIRNEHALMTMRETMRGPGLAIMGPQPKMADMQAMVEKTGAPLNLETLFGSIDYCECDDCLSVYSPAAYFVDILQYLRNNDLDPKNPQSGQSGITAGTPLANLFLRRPDLGCLELTCENTFTVLPYVDLANEVMESFLVHLDTYPGKTILEVFNVMGETTSELLAQPQHVNYQAYCTLKSAVYPFTLPYHQPIDVIRIWLKYFKTTRWELLDIFRTPTETCDSVVLTGDQLKLLRQLHSTVIDRAVDSEFLGITQEEYIILTREAFWLKAYFDLTLPVGPTTDEYLAKIGVKQVHEYYGYTGKTGEADMLSVDETAQLGLTFVRKQFLPRTRVLYTDLVELLKTRFINPAYPQGEALTLMDSLRFGYRFLKNIVDTSTDPNDPYAALITFLNTNQPLVPLINARLHPDPCHPQTPDPCAEQDFSNWVRCYFKRIGKLIVLESGEGPLLPIEGQLFDSQTLIGMLRKNGNIVAANDGTTLIGQVAVTNVVDSSATASQAGPVVWANGKTFAEQFGTNFLEVKNDANSTAIGAIETDGFLYDAGFETLVRWQPARDTCDLEKVRLTHLDGSTLESAEYDRIQRFIRLWHKLGWSIDETDQALVGLSTNPGSTASGDGTVSANCDFVGLDTFQDNCPTTNGGPTGSGCCADEGGNAGCPDIPPAPQDISTIFLHQLVAVQKLLDLTGLPLAKLLTFWANISTAGEKSLYARLFLTHNLLGIDKVFLSDKNGNFLTAGAKISDHMPVLMAALKMKADDIAALIAFRGLSDVLTLANVSALYRHSLLAKLLHVRVANLAEVIALLGDPFLSASNTLALLTDWGKMEDAGFTFRQLDYIVLDHDDSNRPLAPKQKTILLMARTLFDGLNAIDRDHRDITADKIDDATDNLIRTKAGLIYEASTVEGILGLLDGTTPYTTNAPAGQTVVIPASLTAKLKYSNQKDAIPAAATIQITGILTDAEITLAKTLSALPKWAEAIDRAGKQARHFFNDVIFGIFPDAADAVKNLLAGDVNVAPDPNNPSATDANTAPKKRLYFLQGFLPFLRKRLAHKLVVDTLSGAVGLANDVVDLLLSEILVAGPSKDPAIDVLEKLQQQPAGAPTGFKGELIPPTNDFYTFVAISDSQPPPLILNGVSIPFPNQQDDPNNVWWTDPPVKLKAATLYSLETSVVALQWKTSVSPRAAIPASALLPDYATQGATEAFVKLFKAALVANGFNLSADEVQYLHKQQADFDLLNFNAITMQNWRRLQAYTALRDSLPKTGTTLLDFFMWTHKPDDPAKLSAHIAEVTTWSQDDIDRLIAPKHFDWMSPDFFLNEINLVKLQRAVKVSGSIGVGIDRLFEWASPASKFSVCHAIAEQVQAALRARYDQEDWEQVVKPLYDELRQNQQQALVAYLLVQPDVIKWGVQDADGLFEFFLIDVQMCACMDTSRIKQAISTVQLFVQRCLLGLEAKYGVPSEALDRSRWDWMQKYRVWEANRKVFLYPENWIKSELRDDKSPFYKELESELLQKDINSQTVEDALHSYLFKVDEVANLKVVGLFLDDVRSRLHVFARTRNAPYLFYYRYYQTDQQNWYPWEQVQVDIPSYDVENDKHKVVESGCYLIPIVWNGRLLIFFPQFTSKTLPSRNAGSFKDMSTQPVNNPQNDVSWEIKMGWSEYRNGKWTQKRISTDAILSGVGSVAPPIGIYEFIPSDTGDVLIIDVSRFIDPDEVTFGAFHFQGSTLRTGDPLAQNSNTPVTTDFHNVPGPTSIPHGTISRIFSLQTVGNALPPLFNSVPFFEDTIDNENGDTQIVKASGEAVPFYHTFSHDLLGSLSAGGLDALYGYFATHVGDKADAFGGDAAPTVYHELKRTYSLYNWEAAFHAPMLLVDRLLAAQQFDQALKMCHYVLNPYASGVDDKRFWQFAPFKEIDSENVLEKLFLGLQPNQPNADVDEWRDKPFQPHVVARRRPSAYMKWVAMKYIQIWIAYGDYYLRQNTLETIPLAIQCYVVASHVYGPAGQKIPKRGKTLPQTYYSLLDKWDAFSNAMVELELAFPFSNQTSQKIGDSSGVVGLPNIFGFATTLYFCIPDNPELRALRDLIDDRLFKIRHCEDIDGVFRQLPLFEPPIDPALLVQATAQGLSLSSVLNDLNSPMPNYRFYYLLQKALELCAEVKSLGNAFLSAKEKGDAEALANLRARHESSIYKLAMEVKKQQLDESTKALDALQQSRKGPVYRLKHHLKLIGEDLGKVPGADTDFGELADSIEQPVGESGLKLIPFEKEEMDKASEAADRQEDIGAVEVLASILNIIPSFSVDVKPIGIGAGLSFGGSNLGSAAQAVARSMQVVVGNRTFSSTQAGRKAGFLRQLQERIQQANIAGYEIKNIDKQVLTQQIRINIAQQEITNQQKQIDNAQEMEEFLRNKYTNQDLYSWMDGQVKTLYHQAYNLAYDLAKRAEKTFRFERGLTTSDFIHYGYWNAAYDGLFSGERLYVGLKQLEAAYQEKRAHDFEISKSISLRQLNPLALLHLRETGMCEFTLPELIFDMDYPGHFMRRVKSVALRIPCVLGTHTSLNCTLRLLEHKFRMSAIAKGKADYPEQTDGSEERFTTINVPIAAIAVSSLEDESGMFELNFHDERYLPFEGAGVISKWRIQLPDKFRQFDYDTMTDVVIRLRYTSLDGGDKLKQPATDSVIDYIKSVEDLSRDEGLFAAFDLKNDFSDAWYTANHPPAAATERVFTIEKLNEKLPVFTKGRPAAKIQATDIYLFASSALSAASFTATQGGNAITFTDGPMAGTMKSFVAKDVGSAMDSLQIKIGDTKTAIDKMWLLERYTLT